MESRKQPHQRESPLQGQVWGLQYARLCSQLCQEVFEAYGSVGVLSRSVEQCRGHPKCWVEIHVDASASHVLCG